MLVLFGCVDRNLVKSSWKLTEFAYFCIHSLQYKELEISAYVFEQMDRTNLY